MRIFVFVMALCHSCWCLWRPHHLVRTQRFVLHSTSEFDPAERVPASYIYARDAERRLQESINEKFGILIEQGNKLEERLDEQGNKLEERLDEQRKRLDEQGNKLEERLDKLDKSISNFKFFIVGLAALIIVTQAQSVKDVVTGLISYFI
jgi:hypothetical protein